MNKKIKLNVSGIECDSVSVEKSHDGEAIELELKGVCLTSLLEDIETHILINHIGREAIQEYYEEEREFHKGY